MLLLGKVVFLNGPFFFAATQLRALQLLSISSDAGGAISISVSLTDESGNFSPSAALYGDIPCDCYVPLNLPLLGALTKSAKLIGGFTNVFQGLLKFVGVWGKYTAAVGDAARKAKGFRWHQGLKKFMHPLEGQLSALKKAYSSHKKLVNC